MHLFNKVKYQTPESVELEFTLAGIGSRTWALLVDYHILGFVSILFFIVWLTVSVQLIDFGNKIFGSDKVGLWLYAIAILASFILYSGYFVIFETLWQGQTPGKRIAKIRAIRDDGRPVRLPQAVLRSLLRPIDDTLFLGLFLIIFSRKEKRLGDWVAGTIVIQTEFNELKVTKINLSPQAQLLARELQEMADFGKMSADDFATIREYLQRRGQMTTKARAHLSLDLEKQLMEIVGLDQSYQPVGSDVVADIFLEAAYLAYQQTVAP